MDGRETNELTSSLLLLQTIAESIGINKLDETVAVALAGDVEFRLHQVIEVSDLSAPFASGDSTKKARREGTAELKEEARVEPSIQRIWDELGR